MDAPVTAKTALLQVLLEGRGYGFELAERVKNRTEGHITLSQGSLYPALKKFEEAGLVKAFDEQGKKKKDDHEGRPRIYYVLTKSGMKEALAQRQMLVQLIGAAPVVASTPAPEPAPAPEPEPAPAPT
jgi:PadR family transcriptional regulator PadR